MTTFEYNVRNLPIRRIDHGGRTGTPGAYAYDRTAFLPAGHVGERMTDAAGHITDTVYDRMGRVSHVVSGTHSATYAYTDTGLRESLVYGSGARADYTYTEDGLLESLINRKGDGTVIDSYAYTYDASHNQTAKTDGKGTTTYTYDNLNRLLTVSEPNGRSTAYTFDAAGNRLTETVAQGATITVKTSANNEQNRLTSLETRINGTLTETRLYVWDAAGNLLTTTANGTLVQENAYDDRNQLMTTTAGGIRLDNTYNGEGLRVSKRTGGLNGPEERFQLDGDRVVLETDGAGNTLAVNVYGTNLLFRTSGSDAYAYLNNGHADVTALVQPDGQVAGTWYYDAFGVPTEHTGVESPYTYARYRYDDETGLYYLNARMYDPELARFLQEDTYRGEPNDPLSLNLYAYCHNEPLMYSDPTGHVAQREYDPGIAPTTFLHKVGVVGKTVNNALSAFQKMNPLMNPLYVFDQIASVPQIMEQSKQHAKDIDDAISLYKRYSTDKNLAVVGASIGNAATLGALRDAYKTMGIDYNSRTGVDRVVPLGSDEHLRASTNTVVNTAVIVAVGKLSKMGTGPVERPGVIYEGGIETSTTKVGRWMSQSEYETMLKTGKATESYTGTTHVASPADYNAFYKQAKPGTVYVEFDVPRGSLKPTNEGWAKIVGPNSLEGRLAAKKGTACS